MQLSRAIIFVALLGFSIVPFIVAPPEKSFASGQAELQQALDNMSTEERETVNEKTERLLSEALKMLEEVQPHQKRYWYEVFTLFLQSMLDTVKEEKKYVKKEDVQLSDENPVSTVNGEQQKSPALPQFLKESSLLTTDTISSQAVPEAIHQQTVQEMSEAQSTLPKNIPIHDEEEVTTTAIIPISTENPYIQLEDDELMRQLRRLHIIADPKRSPSTRIPFVNPLTPTTTIEPLYPETTIKPLTPATSVKRSSFVTYYQAASDEEKRRIEINMAKEVRELHRLGAKQKEINMAMGVNTQELPDGLKLVKVGQDDEIRKVQDINAEDAMIYKINDNTKPFTNPYPPKPYMNNSFEGMHINLPSMKEHIVTNQMQGGYRWVPYNARMSTDQRNIENTLHKLQRENYLLKTQLMSYTRPNINMHKIRGVTFSGTNHMNQFLPHETRYPTEFSMGQSVRNPVSTPILTPYPYITNSYLKNFTLHGNIGKTSSLVSKPVPENINSEFTDEMKRELRDGKVILLSDSVVRSNFEPEKGRDEGGKEIEKERNEGGKETKVIPPEVDETGIQAPNIVSG